MACESDIHTEFLLNPYCIFLPENLRPFFLKIKFAPLTGMKIININKNYEKVSFIIDIAFVHGGYFL